MRTPSEDGGICPPSLKIHKSSKPKGPGDAEENDRPAIVAAIASAAIARIARVSPAIVPVAPAPGPISPASAPAPASVPAPSAMSPASMAPVTPVSPASAPSHFRYRFLRITQLSNDWVPLYDRHCSLHRLCEAQACGQGCWEDHRFKNCCHVPTP
jgi:hypothetical protein